MILEFSYVFVFVVLERIDYGRFSQKPGRLFVCLELCIHEILAAFLSKYEVFRIVVGRDRFFYLACFSFFFEVRCSLVYDGAITDFRILRRIFGLVIGRIEEIAYIGGKLSDILVASFVYGFEVLFHIVVDLLEFPAHDDLKSDLLGTEDSYGTNVVFYGLGFPCFVRLDAGIDISGIFGACSKNRHGRESYC